MTDVALTLIQPPMQATLAAARSDMRLALLAPAAPTAAKPVPMLPLVGVPLSGLVGPAGPAGETGPEGPPGPAGIGAQPIVVALDSQATEKVITHSLGRLPNVQVINSAGDIIYVDVTHLDDATVRVSYAFPMSGSVVLT